MASQRPLTVRSAAFRRCALSFEKAFSIGVEVGTIRRQIKQARARRLDHRTDGGPFVARQIVHPDDVARRQFGNEDFCDIDFESVPIDGTVEDEGRRDAADPKTGDEGRRLSVMGLPTIEQAKMGRR